ncbi:hypothetical protein GO755_26535 [Spirosoma sp. HMF4905]|uniref:Uncharacterized protein n=1 Tax=Spirosoma arboris TaxID=2682092 RepID=A0A7K1SIS2_9BACT|nr:hypothetical protein [Spirosoma arboris]MVM33624.1 hypothetical protein [Spirosoma arboris]
MAKIIVVYDLPDPLHMLEGEIGEQQLWDIQHWLQEDLLGTELEHTHPSLNAPLFERISVISEADYTLSNRSVWQRGASN